MWCVGEFGDLLVAAEKPNDAGKGDDESISITVTPSLCSPLLPDPHLPDAPSLSASPHLFMPSKFRCQVSETDVLTLMERTLKDPLTIPVTRQYALTALMKLTSRFSPQHVKYVLPPPPSPPSSSSYPPTAIVLTAR